MLAQLQQQLAQPTRFDTDAFNQIRQAQAANLQQEFGAQKQLMDEEMARRGIYASSISAGRFGDLLGQQARALSSLDAELLQQAAQTQAQDRLAAMQAGVDFSQLAGSQDLSEFEANRVAQAQQFQEALQSALMQQSQFEAGGAQALAAAQAAGQFGLSGRELDLRAQQLQQEAQLQGRSLDLQEARDIAQREQFQTEIETRKEQFYSTLGQEESQFARSLDEQRSARLQSLGIAESQLELEAVRVVQGDRSLDLQQARDIAEIDIRARSLQQEAQLQGRSLDLQQARQEAENQLGRDRLLEESAARMQQFGIATQQLGLEVRRVENQAAQFQQSITLEAAIRTAEVNLRAQQIQNDYERSGQAIDLDRARLQAQQEIEANRIQFSREELGARQRQFDLDINLRERLGTRDLDIREKQADIALYALMLELGLDPKEFGFDDEGERPPQPPPPQPPQQPLPPPPPPPPPSPEGEPYEPEMPWTPPPYIPSGPGDGMTVDPSRPPGEYEPPDGADPGDGRDPRFDTPTTTQIENIVSGGGGGGGYLNEDSDLLQELYRMLGLY